MKLLPTSGNPRVLRRRLLAFCVMLLTSATVLATDIWLAGTDPVVRRTSYKDERATDYMQLFNDNNAPWQNAAKHVQAFKVSTQFVLQATDDQLAKMFAGLKKRNIAFAEETLMLPLGTNDCGRGVEGYLDPHGMQNVLERIKRLGGDLRYVAMDEPLWFGHVSNHKNSCHSSIEAIARDVATRIAVIKKVFPDVEVGDVEPLATPAEPADWLDEISAWLAAYKEAVGVPLRFFDADVTWSGSWQPQLRSLATRLRAAGVSYGLIYDGDATDSSGIAWVQNAENRFAQVESNPETAPDRAILQSWTLQPEHMLPETQAGTMTYLVNSYSRQRVTLNLRREDRRLSGRLMDSAGKPLAGAKVNVVAVSGDTAGIKSLRTLSGVVPPGAKKAIVALRINSECGCSGVAHVDIGQVIYHDPGSNTTIQRPLLENASDNIFNEMPGQAVSRNSQAFPVTPGGPFTFRASMGATSDSVNSGYLALAFLGAGGQELERLRISFSPATTDLGATATDGSGAFSVPLPATTPPRAAFRAVFSGDATNRPAYASLQ